MNLSDEQDMLSYFDNSDAYTGEPLVNATVDYIIPLDRGGTKVEWNTVPCNVETRDDRNGVNIFKWYNPYKSFSQERLNKILSWMGVYQKYLYMSEEQREFVDVVNGGSIYHYGITLPNGRKQRLFYANNGSLSTRVEILNRMILNKWSDYLNDCWIYYGKISPIGYNHEDKVKSLLDRCADFLFTNADNTYNKKAILNRDKVDKIFEREIPLSCTASNVQEKVYGSGALPEGEYTYYECKPTIRTSKSKYVKKWKDSATYKLNQIDDCNTLTWCTVNTVNEFIYKEETYTINKKVNQYCIDKNRNSGNKVEDTYKNVYVMDSILVCECKNNITFYDQDINKIDSEYVTLGRNFKGDKN